MDEEKQIDLLGHYAEFLESNLLGTGISFDDEEVMEVTDKKFNIVSDHFNRENICSHRIVTLDYLQEYLNDPTIYPNVNVVYAQLPFDNSRELIRKLSLVPYITSSLAVFGAYGLKEDHRDYKNNSKNLKKFAKSLASKGIDYEFKTEENLTDYYNLIITKQKKLLK